MNTAIYMMYQAPEVDDTVSAIRMLSPQLSDNCRLFVLGNGMLLIPSQFKEFESNRNISFFESATNLGVAGGRNRLISEILSTFKPDIFVSLDNDIVVPADYISKIKHHFSSTPFNIGVASPVIVQGTYLDLKDLKGYVYPDKSKLVSAVRKIYFDDKIKAIFYHAGVANWKLHYLYDNKLSHLLIRIKNKIKSIVLQEEVKMVRTFLGRNKEFVQSLFDAPEIIERRVDSLPGGTHCYRRELIDRIGTYDDSFNPFGYEDADFCIRSLKARFDNVLFSDLLVIHDIGLRFSTRPYIHKLEHYGRSKKNLLRRHSSGLMRVFLYFAFFAFFPLHILKKCHQLKQDRPLAHIWRFWSYFAKS